MGSCLSSTQSAVNPNVISRKRKTLPIDASFKLPAPLPSWPPGEGFGSGIIDLGDGLQVCLLSSFNKVWATHEGGPDNLGASFFEPSQFPQGFSMLGSYSQPNNTLLHGWVLAGRDDTGSALKQPIDYTLVWSSDSLRIKQDGVGYIWLPSPPDGYKAVGHVVTNSPQKPPLGKIHCVRSDLTDQCEFDSWIWGPDDDTYWMDLPLDEAAKERVKKGNLQDSQVYLHIKPMLGATFTDIAVWVFYPFNGPSKAKVEFISIPLGKIGEHVGDWEHVTLRINNFNGELWSVYFSEHGGGTWVKASELEFQNGNKAVTYSSLHGHAMYAKPGLVLQGRGGIGIRNDTAKSKKSMDTGTNSLVVAAEYLGTAAVKEPPWLNYFRKWGPKVTYDISEEIKKCNPHSQHHGKARVFGRAAQGSILSFKFSTLFQYSGNLFESTGNLECSHQLTWFHLLETAEYVYEEGQTATPPSLCLCEDADYELLSASSTLLLVTSNHRGSLLILTLSCDDGDGGL
ncbi:hypothetical protein D5086_017664 [Populus alba]|uniref:Uncharacterized protein n=1 Tax=Populus alba TaxID=43335 RepID=A0ACC4BN03_POPAL